MQVLAAAGVASRRAAEELIFAGDVKLNGKVVTVPQTLAHPQQDKVSTGPLVTARMPSATASAGERCLCTAVGCRPRSVVCALQIEVKGKVVTAQPQRKFYFAVNKPKASLDSLFPRLCYLYSVVLLQKSADSCTTGSRAPCTGQCIHQPGTGGRGRQQPPLRLGRPQITLI